MRRAVLASAVLLALVVSVLATPATADDVEVRLSGSYHRSSSSTVPAAGLGVVLTCLADCGARTLTATTDTDGRFEVMLQPGLWSLTTTPPADDEWLWTRERTVRVTGDVELASRAVYRGGNAVGRLVDGQGRGVQGAFGETTTNADGRFTTPVGGFGSGPATALATAQARVPKRVAFDRRAGATVDVGDVVLPASGSLTVTVVDTRGRAVPGALVGLVSRPKDLEVSSSERTGSDGVARLVVLPEGDAGVFVEQVATHFGATTTATVVGRQDRAVRVVVRPAGVVRAQVRSPRGEVLHGMSLEIASASRHLYGTSDDLVGPLPAGRYVVLARDKDGNRISAEATVKIAEGATTVVPLTMHLGGRVRGVQRATYVPRGRFEGWVALERLVKGRWSLFDHAAAQRYRSRAVIDVSGGAFDLGPVPPGRYRIRSGDRDNPIQAEWVGSSFDVAAGQVVARDAKVVRCPRTNGGARVSRPRAGHVVTLTRARWAEPNVAAQYQWYVGGKRYRPKSDAPRLAMKFRGRSLKIVQLSEAPGTKKCTKIVAEGLTIR